MTNPYMIARPTTRGYQMLSFITAKDDKEAKSMYRSWLKKGIYAEVASLFAMGDPKNDVVGGYVQANLLRLVA